VVRSPLPSPPSTLLSAHLWSICKKCHVSTSCMDMKDAATPLEVTCRTFSFWKLCKMPLGIFLRSSEKDPTESDFYFFYATPYLIWEFLYHVERLSIIKSTIFELLMPWLLHRPFKSYLKPE
jgi:hypothetical protein